MSIHADGVVDAAMVLEGLARLYEALPDDQVSPHRLRHRQELITDLHRLARRIHPNPRVFRYDEEWSAEALRNELLAGIYPTDEAVLLIHQADRRPGRALSCRSR